MQAAGNAIAMLPPKLYLCTALATLDLSRNALLAFQGRVYVLKHLRHLDLSRNRLRFLPSALGWLRLTHLDVSGNPALRVPAVVHDARALGGVAALLTYHQIVCEQLRIIERHLDRMTHHRTITLPANFAKSGAPRSPLLRHAARRPRGGNTRGACRPG